MYKISLFTALKCVILFYYHESGLVAKEENWKRMYGSLCSRFDLNFTCVHDPSSRAVRIHLQHALRLRVHLGWTQTAPLGAFMLTTMWLS